MAGARPPLQANTCQLGAEAGPQSAGFVEIQHCDAVQLLLVHGSGGSPPRESAEITRKQKPRIPLERGLVTGSFRDAPEHLDPFGRSYV